LTNETGIDYSEGGWKDEKKIVVEKAKVCICF
jgi:hypothetical protein